MADSLGRDEILSGLRELIAELHSAGEVAGIRLVGGAALGSNTEKYHHPGILRPAALWTHSGLS